MRFAFFSVLVALLVAVAMAVPPHIVSVIVSWPKGTPDSVVEAAKEMIRKGKGKITHEYNIIKGFACEIAQNDIPSIQALSSEYPALIEGDGIMTTQNDDKKSNVGVHY